ncbi:MAG TPA: hypothetical protein VF680_17290 [Allosphingosinicella sp.]|jgi:hypothetical protein
MNNLRNCILIALAFDATQQEIEHAHDVIDRVYGPTGTAGVDPAYLVGAEVPATANGVTANGLAVQTNTLPAAANATPPAATAEVPAADKNGMPWDERIHSSSKAITDKGVWRLKRGVNPAIVKQVEAELLATVGATPTATPPAIAPLAAATPPALPGQGLPSLPGANVQPIADPAYTAFVQFIADNTASPANPAGRLTAEWVGQVLAAYGVAEGSLQNLAHNPALIPQIETYIRAQLGG